MGRLRAAVGENVCYLTKCGGATMLLTYARRCICDARYSGQNLKRVGILRQGGNILPLSIQRGNLQPYIFRGQHITSYILMGGILPPPLLLIYEPKIGNGYLKRLSKRCFIPTNVLHTRHKREKAVQYRYLSRSIFGYRHDAIAIFF